MKTLIDALAQCASDWVDPEYPARVQAVEDTLDLDNRFTEEAIAFAVNQQMALLTVPALTAWQKALGGADVGEGRVIGVLNPGNIPMVEMQDFVAAMITGFGYAGTVSRRSAALFPAFVDDLAHRYDIDARLGTLRDVLSVADALIASGDDDTMQDIRSRAREAGLADEAMWLRGHRVSVAIMDGGEDEEERLDLAEDALLHDGTGCRNVSIVFAPSDLSPDALLEAFATFRGLFPAHERTSGALKMQQAFLAAIDAPHAWADGLPFLLSKGAPESQGPGHVRWSDYGHPDGVTAWITSHMDELQAVFVRRGRMDIWSERLGIPVEPFGSAQRPALDWEPDRRSHADFFRGLIPSP